MAYVLMDARLQYMRYYIYIYIRGSARKKEMHVASHGLREQEEDKVSDIN